MLLYILIGVFEVESFPISHAFENIIFIFFHLLTDSPAQLFLIDTFCRLLLSLFQRQLCQQRDQIVFYESQHFLVLPAFSLIVRKKHPKNTATNCCALGCL